MNWILICVLAILAICGYAGWKKGIIRIVLSLAVMVVTIVVTIFAAPLLGKGIKENTTLYDGLYKSVEQAVISSDLFGGAEEKVQTELDDTLLEEADDSQVKQYVRQVVAALHLPDSIAGQVEEVVDADDVAQIQEQGNTAVKAVVSKAIAERMTQIIFNAIIHVIVFVVLFVVLRLVVSVTGMISMLPVIHEANKVLGLAAGLIEGLFFVWIFFALITAFGSQEWAAQALTDIGSSKLLSFLYDNNFILKSVFRSL